MLIFKIAYWAGLIIQLIVRAPFNRTWKTGTKTIQRISLTETILLALLMIGNLVLPRLSQSRLTKEKDLLQ